MKERPIIFSAPMVRALLEGRKTQTRRIIKPQPDLVSDDGVPGIFTPEDEKYGRLGKVIKCPYGKPGDRLWVRENWKVSSAHDDLSIAQLGRLNPLPSLEYLADPEEIFTGKTRPSIYMPRWASRITLEITGVRVERLQEINNDDAKAEGCEFAMPHRHGKDGIVIEDGSEITRDNYAEKHNTGFNDCWICAYKNIWQNINGQGSWDANPWVWVLEFKRVY